MLVRPSVHDDAAHSLRSARWLIWLLVVPVLLLLAVLMAAQVLQRHAALLDAVQQRDSQHARDLALMARPASDYVHDLRLLMQQAWHQPPAHGPELRQALKERVSGGGPDGYTLDAAPDALRERFGQVLWFDPRGGEPPEALLQLSQTFSAAARAAHQRAPAFAASWFLPGGVAMSVGYPWFDSSTSLQSLGERRLRDLARYRASGDEQRRAWATADARMTDYWSPPYIDDSSARLTVSHGGLIVVDGQYRGEVMLDFRLDDLQALLSGWAGDEGRFWIIDERQRVLADSQQPLDATQILGDGGHTLRAPLAERLPAGISVDDIAAARTLHGSPWRRGDWLLVVARDGNSPWTLVHALPAASVTAALWPTLLPYALLALALLAMFITGQWLMARGFVRPALSVLGYLRKLSRDTTAAAPELGARWQPWVETLSSTFEKQRELQLRERHSEAFKSAIVDHALNGIVAADSSGRIVEFNPAAEAMFGRVRADVLGRPVAQVIVPERFREAHDAGMDRMRRGGPPRALGRRMEMDALRADGSEFPVEMVLWRTETDGDVHYVASLSDVSAQRESARQIEAHREALRQSEKLTAMGSLLAGVAHELNNPLAIVMGRASLLESKTEDAELKRDAASIRQAAERSGRIVRAFLAMARQKPRAHGPLALNELVRSALDLLQYGIRSSGIVLELELDDALPVIEGDGDQLGQVVLNLLVNAQQALAALPPPRRLLVQTSSDTARAGAPARVWLRVADDGPGVPAEQRARIFDPFFTTKPEGGGTGLGLAVSRSVAREHGGELVLEDEAPLHDGALPLKGASFRLSLPAASAATDTAASPLAADDGDVETARILVVDDEAELADLIREMLETAGYDVATAESAEVALELLGEARFDAIVTDQRMPGMDGVMLWREVQRRLPALARRVVFVTGDTLSAPARATLEATGCSCVEKPFTADELIAHVQACLRAD